MARPQTISDEQILEAALDCFVQHGPAVSTDVIADRLGVSAQALFKRFHSKHDLLIAALRPPLTAPWIPAIEAGPDDRPFAEQLHDVLLDLADFFVDIARRMSLLRWSGLDLKQMMKDFDEPPPLRDIRVLSEWLNRASQAGLIRKVDFRVTAMMMLSALHGPAMLHDVLEVHPTGHDTEEYVQHVVKQMLHGLLPE